MLQTKTLLKAQRTMSQCLAKVFAYRLYMYYPLSLTFTTSFRLLMALRKKSVKNIVGKRENAGNQHFLHFPQCFVPFPKQISIFDTHLNCRLQMRSIWTYLKFCRLIKS